MIASPVGTIAFQSSLRDYFLLHCLCPAVNCWAIFASSLRDASNRTARMSLLQQSATEHLRSLESGADHVGRADAGVSRSHRGGRRARRRILARRCATGRSQQAADDRRAAREASKPLGRLAGLPVAVKDMLCERGQTDDLRLADARRLPPAVRRDRHRQAHAPPTPCSSAGRTWTSSPWAARPRTRRFKQTRNPWDLERTPGGSSGGSAAARRRRHGAAVDRHRHRRLDPPAGRPVRRRRHEADLRPREPLRPRRLRQQPRPDRPVRRSRSKTPRCCWKRSPATIRATRRRSTCRCRRIRKR